MRGTWCTPELQKAVELGYRMIKINDVWHFPEDQMERGVIYAVSQQMVNA